MQYQARNFAGPGLSDQDSIQAGMVWWLAGHQRNLQFQLFSL